MMSWVGVRVVYLLFVCCVGRGVGLCCCCLVHLSVWVVYVYRNTTLTRARLRRLVSLRSTGVSDGSRLLIPPHGWLDVWLLGLTSSSLIRLAHHVGRPARLAFWAGWDGRSEPVSQPAKILFFLFCWGERWC